MADLPDISPSTLQFVIAAVRTSFGGNLDMSVASNRSKISTQDDRHNFGKPAVRNPNGTAMTVAQIATATNLTTAQVTDILGRI